MAKTILAFGATGLGKTTMANVLCDAVVDGSSGAESATKETCMYETDEFRYIDTRGFDCSSGATDEEIFHDTMRFFQENNIFNIDILLWFCSESERMNNHLQREANFIHRFIEYTDGYQAIDLWENVLIVTKGILLSQKMINGPKSAARNACQATADSFTVKNFPCWIYDLDPEGVPVSSGYRQNEVKSKIQSLFPNSKPIPIHFKRGKCLKCNAIGDPRLFTGRCHTAPSPSHVFDETSIPIFLDDYVDDSTNPNFFKELTHRSITAGLGIYEVVKSAGRWVVSSAGSTTGSVGSFATTSIGSASIGSAAAIGITAGTSVVLAICIGGTMYYYESKNIRCKLCKKFPEEDGCIEICERCKDAWNKTPGCEPLSEHDVVILD